MVVLYTELEIFEEFLLFEDEDPHWNGIAKSGIDICLNINDDDLEHKLSNEEEVIFAAFNQSATMKLPVALKSDIQKIKEDLSTTLDYPRSVFLLEINIEEAIKAQNDYGTAIYSTNDYPKNLFHFSHYLDFDKDDKIPTGWKGILNFKKPLSNSLIITDNHYFKNEDNRINRGCSNLVEFIDAFLPEKLVVEYHITIFAEDCNKSNDWWVKEFGKLVALVKKLRPFDIRLELVLTSSIHRRRLISNYVYSKTDQGYDIFHAKNVETISLDNDFGFYEIFSDLNNLGTKHFQSASKTLEKLEKIGMDVSSFVNSNGNAAGRKLFGCNPDKTIKNRLLN